MPVVTIHVKAQAGAEQLKMYTVAAQNGNSAACTTWESCQLPTKGFTAGLWEKLFFCWEMLQEALELKCSANLSNLISVTRQRVSIDFRFLFSQLISASFPKLQCLQLSEMSIWWHVIYSLCDCYTLCSLTSQRFSLRASLRLLSWKFPLAFISRCQLVSTVLWLCDYFPALLSPCGLFLLAAGQKWAGREKGMAQKKKTPEAPTPGLLVVMCSSASLLLAKKRDIEMLCLISLILCGWNTSLTCTKSRLQVFLYFDSAFVWTSIFLFVVKSLFIHLHFFTPLL